MLRGRFYFSSGLAGSGSQEEGAGLTWTGEHTTGGGEREGNSALGHICHLLTEREGGRVKVFKSAKT